MAQVPTWAQVHENPSALAVELQRWCQAEPWTVLGEDWRAVYSTRLVELLTHATAEDCAFAGFELDPGMPHLSGSLVVPGCVVRVEFNRGGGPDGVPDHRAVSVEDGTLSTCRLWGDGVRLPVPERDGLPAGAPNNVDWLDGRWLSMQLVDCWEHPGQGRNPVRYNPFHSTVRGLLLWDAVTGATRVERPTDDEDWTYPVVSRVAGGLAVHADLETQRGGRPPSRVVPAPW